MSAPTAPAATFEPGGLFRRFLAAVVDAVVPTVALTAYWLGAVRLEQGQLVLVLTILTGLIVLAWGVYVWWCGGERAATPGMRLLDLELVDIRTGRQVGWGRFFARSLVYSLLAMTGIGLMLMVIWLVADAHHRGWHDRAAAGIVIARKLDTPAADDAAPQPTTRPRVTTVGLPLHLTGGTSFAPVQTAGLGGAAPPPSAEPAPTQPTPNRAPRQVPQWGDHRPPGPTGWTPPQVQPQRQPVPSGPISAVPGMGPAQPGPQPGPQPVVTADADADHTRIAPNRATRAAGARAAAPASAGAWSVVLEDGREIPLRGMMLLGRNPEPAPGEQAELVAVTNTRMVSKTHLLVATDAHGPYVVDRGSTNGSAVEGADGEFQRCTPGERVRVEAGRVVTFGDRKLALRRD